jgi:hypothetical protein
MTDQQAANYAENIGPDLAIQPLSSEDASLIRGGGTVWDVVLGVGLLLATEWSSGQVAAGYKKLGDSIKSANDANEKARKKLAQQIL